MDICKEVEQIKNDLITLRRTFHQIPEIGLHEFETTKLIIQKLQKCNIECYPTGKTGVIAYIGKGEKTIALRADIDGLPILEKTNAAYSSKTDGMMHACGHDAHIACLLGAAQILKQHEEELSNRIKLIFQPSEENCKGAKYVCGLGEADDIDCIFGLHVFTDIPCGQISIEAGPRMAITDLFHIDITGKSGHAGKPHQCIDATVVGSAIIMNLQSVRSRELDPSRASTISIGHFVSGTQYNIVSGSALIEGTVRTFLPEDSKLIKESITRVAEHTASAYRANAKVVYEESMHPAVVNDEEETKIALQGAKKVLPESMFVTIPPIFLGEDFSLYQQKIPGVYAFVGAGNKALNCCYPNHHDCFNIDENAIIYGTMLHLAYVMEHN